MYDPTRQDRRDAEMDELREALGRTRCAGLPDDQVLALARGDLDLYTELLASVDRAKGILSQFWTPAEVDSLFAEGRLLAAATIVRAAATCEPGAVGVSSKKGS